MIKFNSKIFLLSYDYATLDRMILSLFGKQNLGSVEDAAVLEIMNCNQTETNHFLFPPVFKRSKDVSKKGKTNVSMPGKGL